MKPAITTISGMEIAQPRAYIWVRIVEGQAVIGHGDLADLANDDQAMDSPYRVRTFTADARANREGIGDYEVTIHEDESNPDFVTVMATGPGVTPEVTRRYDS